MVVKRNKKFNQGIGIGLDVDFILWGPFANQGDMCSGLSAANIVDCSYSANPTETCTITLQNHFHAPVSDLPTVTF